jgi:hypothetical protein
MDFVKKLHKELEADQNYNVLLDYEDLHVADEWRPELYSWMLVCDLAIIVVSHSVPSKSRWVPRESLVLRWRHQSDTGFQLCVVLVDGLTEDVLKQPPFDGIGLDDLQALKLNDKFQEIGRVIQEVNRLSAKTCPGDTEAARIEEVLKGDVLHEQRIQKAAECVALDLRTWAATFDPCRALAIRLAHYGFLKNDSGRPGVDAVGVLEDALRKEQFYKLFGIMTPLWVDRSAAARLYQLVTRKTRGAIVLGCHGKQTPDHYISRAWSLKFGGRPAKYEMPAVIRHVDTMEPEGVESGRLAELKESVYEACREEADENLQGLPLTAAAKANIDEMFKTRIEDGKPAVLLCVPEQICTLDEVVALQQAMPDIVFLYLGRDADVNPSVAVVSPELEPEVEKAAYKDVNAARKYLKLTPGGNG